MNTCSTCKFFEPNNDPNKFGNCNNDQIAYEPEAYDLEKIQGVTVLAMYGDSEGYRAWFTPSADFGCILHQLKELPRYSASFN